MVYLKNPVIFAQKMVRMYKFNIIYNNLKSIVINDITLLNIINNHSNYTLILTLPRYYSNELIDIYSISYYKTDLSIKYNFYELKDYQVIGNIYNIEYIKILLTFNFKCMNRLSISDIRKIKLENII